MERIRKRVDEVVKDKKTAEALKVGWWHFSSRPFPNLPFPPPS